MTDTPTHRTTILQHSINDIIKIVEDVRTRRNAIEEKIVKLKTNNKLEREAQVHKQLQKTLLKLDTLLEKANAAMGKLDDELNKGRALFFELSDGQILLDKSGITESTSNRGEPSPSSTASKPD